MIIVIALKKKIYFLGGEEGDMIIVGDYETAGGNIIRTYDRIKGKSYEKDKGENNMEDNKKPTEQRNLKKSDLKNGDIVELRNGRRYVYIEKYVEWYSYNPEICRKIISLEHGGNIELFRYDNDLLFDYRGNCEFDIMKILDMSEFYENPKWTLERKQRKQEEMTLEEICQELGRDIKIVKEKSND